MRWLGFLHRLQLFSDGNRPEWRDVLIVRREGVVVPLGVVSNTNLNSNNFDGTVDSISRNQDDDRMSDDQAELWTLVYSTIRMKQGRDSSPYACLNFLANERRTGEGTILINEETAVVREELWTTDQLNTIEPQHRKIHDFEDDRPIVVFEHKNRKLLVDGNHRVARWIAQGKIRTHRILLVSMRKKTVTVS